MFAGHAQRIAHRSEGRADQVAERHQEGDRRLEDEALAEQQVQVIAEAGDAAEQEARHHRGELDVVVERPAQRGHVARVEMLRDLRPQSLAGRHRPHRDKLRQGAQRGVGPDHPGRRIGAQDEYVHEAHHPVDEQADRHPDRVRQDHRHHPPLLGALLHRSDGPRFGAVRLAPLREVGADADSAHGHLEGADGDHRLWRWRHEEGQADQGEPDQRLHVERQKRKARRSTAAPVVGAQHREIRGDRQSDHGDQQHHVEIRVVVHASHQDAAHAQSRDQRQGEVHREHDDPQPAHDAVRAGQVAVAPADVLEQSEVEAQRGQYLQGRIDVADDVDQPVAGRPDHSPDHDAGDERQRLLHQLAAGHDRDVGREDPPPYAVWEREQRQELNCPKRASQHPGQSRASDKAWRRSWRDRRSPCGTLARGEQANRFSCGRLMNGR